MRRSSLTVLAAFLLALSCTDEGNGSAPAPSASDDEGALDERALDGASARELGAAGASASAPHQAQAYCAQATRVDGPRQRFTGDDFSDDFSDRIELTDPSCSAAEPGGSDALFEVPLLAGQEFSVAENGGLDAVVSIQTSCEASAACDVSEDEPDDPVVDYTAPEDQLVYVVVQSYRAVPSVGDYEIRIDIDPECGNGVLEGREPCDDGNDQDGDGCSAACSVEFGYDCQSQDSQPNSVCEPVPFLGSYAGGAAIAPVENQNTLDAGDTVYYRIRFTERVVLSGEATVDNGSVDLQVLDQGFNLVYLGATSPPAPDEPIEPTGLEAGDYLIGVSADLAARDGFTLTLETRSGGTCGDADLEPAFEECDNGEGQGCTDCKVVFGWECDDDSPTTCTQIRDLGHVGADDTVLDDVVPGPHESLYIEQWMVTFDSDVSLSGSFGATGTNELLLDLFDANRDAPVSLLLRSGQTFDSMPVPAGTYRLSAQILGELASDGYTLTLTTAEQR